MSKGSKSGSSWSSSKSSISWNRDSSTSTLFPATRLWGTTQNNKCYTFHSVTLLTWKYIHIHITCNKHIMQVNAKSLEAIGDSSDILENCMKYLSICLSFVVAFHLCQTQKTSLFSQCFIILLLLLLGLSLMKARPENTSPSQSGQDVGRCRTRNQCTFWVFSLNTLVWFKTTTSIWLV